VGCILELLLFRRRRRRRLLLLVLRCRGMVLLGILIRLAGIRTNCTSTWELGLRVIWVCWFHPVGDRLSDGNGDDEFRKGGDDGILRSSRGRQESDAQISASPLSQPQDSHLTRSCSMLCLF